MEYLARISEIETRALAVNMTLHEVCTKAGVKFHGVSRWKNGDVSPTARTVERDLSALERFLDDQERLLFARLEPKFRKAGSLLLAS
jgi:transcriptional regulator with XRE-family HTH domain